MEPPRHLAFLAGTFEQALRTMIRLARDFCETFQLVRGYERYTVQRLRTEILDVVWTPLQDATDLSSGQSERLQETFEKWVLLALYTSVSRLMPALSASSWHSFTTLYTSDPSSLH